MERCACLFPFIPQEAAYIYQELGDKYMWTVSRGGGLLVSVGP